MEAIQTPQAAFVNMMMERLHALESLTDRQQHELRFLRTALDARAPAITVTPESKYTKFSDGKNMCWEIGEQPVIFPNRSSFENELGDVEMIPLDAAHQHAIIFTEPTIIRLALYDEAYSGPCLPATDPRLTCYYRLIGTAGIPVTLHQFVDSFHEWLDCKISGEETLRSLLVDDEGRIGRCDGLFPPEPGEAFRGVTMHFSE